tara:strand:+ start:1386 stop:2291 length:906 start_codon:yes stop_codon:yes gene_type:complete
MSNTEDNKKKGFFSRLFGGFGASKEQEQVVSSDEDIIEAPSEDPKVNTESISKTALNKMKKADIVEAAKENGLDLDINLTKAKLLEAWDLHFNQSPSPSAVDDAATVMAEVAAKEESEEVPSKEEAPVDVASAEEEAPAEEAPIEEAPAEETPAEEEAPADEAPIEEAPAEEEATAEVKVSLEEQTPSQIISNFESKQMKTDLPEFRPGDTVVVSVKVREGERTRLQAFEGVVMSVKKAGLNSSFIVRKISSGIGVERTFQTHSPMIDSIKVKRKGDVRQAKLFYLRDRSGKSARIKERLE